MLFDILRFVSCCDLWTLSKHHRNLWLDKWSPKHFLPSDTHFLIVQGRFWVLNCLHSRESKPKSGLSTGFWLAQRQWHELCALTALEMKRSRTLCRDMMYYDELRTKKWLVTLSHGKTVSPKVQQFQRTCWYYSQWYCTQLMNRQQWKWTLKTYFPAQAQQSVSTAVSGDQRRESASHLQSRPCFPTYNAEPHWLSQSSMKIPQDQVNDVVKASKTAPSSKFQAFP